MSKLNELVEWHYKVVEGGYFPPSNLIMDKARSLLAEEAAQKPTIDGNTSDGYHTFNELYDHRIALYLDIVAQNSEWFWKSKKHEDGSEFPGWFILGGNMGTGDISYHLPLDKWDMAKCKEIPLGKKWDGHTAKDVVERILRHSQAPNTSRPTAPASLVDELLSGINMALDKMRKEPKVLTMEAKGHYEGCWDTYMGFKKILSRYTPTESIAEEPLAVLAQRKDRIIWIEGPYKPAGKKGWTIHVLNHEQHHYSIEIIWGRTYAAAEAKARQYLESLPDHKEEKKK